MATDKQPRWKPSKTFYFAMTLAGIGHEEDTRKGSDIPYLGHLLGVASIVIEAGGTENQAAGALLHSGHCVGLHRHDVCAKARD